MVKSKDDAGHWGVSVGSNDRRSEGALGRSGRSNVPILGSGGGQRSLGNGRVMIGMEPMTIGSDWNWGGS
jgi:hypothetical protein